MNSRKVTAESVIAVIAEVTRYPVSVLTAEAVLEDDLGIDSLKRVEIWAALERQFGAGNPKLEALIANGTAGPPNLADFKLSDEDAQRIASIRTVGDVIAACATLEQRAEQLAEKPEGDALPPVPALPVELPVSAASGSATSRVNGSGGGSGYGAPVSAARPAAAVAAAAADEMMSVASEFSAHSTAPADRERYSHGEAETLAMAAERIAASPSVAPMRKNGPIHVPDRGPQPVQTVPARQLDGAVERFALHLGYPSEAVFPEALLEEDLGLTQDRVRQLLEEMGAAARAQMPRTVKELLDGSGYAEPAGPRPAGRPRDGRPEEKPLAGKIAFVTGSGRGVGRVIAHTLARAGATVIVNSFHSKDKGEAATREIQAGGGRAVHLWGSVAKEDHLQRMFKEIESQFGGLDFFVANASNGIIAPLARIEAAHWEKGFRTNVIGLHQAALLAVPLMRKRGGGRIVTMSSFAAHRVADYFACMAAVKAAVESLTRYLAVEFAPDGIEAVCISTGAVEGELMTIWPEAKRLQEFWASRSLVGRLITEQEYADLILRHLLSPPGLFVGQTIVADGGALARA